MRTNRRLPHRWAAVWLVASATAACQATHALPTPDLQQLHRTHDTTRDSSSLMYTGTVSAVSAPNDPLFYYSRRVEQGESTWESTHLTVSTQGHPVVLQVARHSPTYALESFRQTHAQTGQVAEVTLQADGTTTYQTHLNGRTRTRVEHADGPVHVGPTLFGFVQQHWQTLDAGQPIDLRFAVVERRRSFPFRIRKTDQDADSTTVQMTPKNPILALVVPTMTMTFNLEGHIIHYAGPVPPRRDRNRPLNASVTYTHTDDDSPEEPG